MNKIDPSVALWTSLFITSAYPVAGKFAVGYLAPSLILLLGSFLAFLFWAPWLSKNKCWGRFFDKDALFNFLMIGLFGTALPFLCIMIALIYTTPANAAILNQAEVVYSLILSMIFLKERPTLKQLAGTVMVISGVAVILTGDDFSIRWKGDLIVVGSVWMFQVAHVFAKKLPADLMPQQISAARAMFSFLWSIPLTLILYAFSFDVTTFVPGARTLVIILYMGFNYSVGNAMWYRAIRSMDLSKATAVILSYPVFTYIISIFSGTDKVSLSKITGLALALAGAYMVTNLIKSAKSEV